MMIDNVRERRLLGVRSINKEILASGAAFRCSPSLSAVTEKLCHHQNLNSDRVRAGLSAPPRA